MLLRDRNAVIYGAGGAVGGAVAPAFAREGARVFLAGRTIARLDAVAKEITAEGGEADSAQVDARDQRAVEEHAAAVAEQAGSIDVSFNAIGIDHVQAIPLLELSPEDFALPIATYPRTQFVTSTAAARHMTGKRTGVILTLSTTASRVPGAMTGGFGAACTAVEAFSRQLAAELGPYGIRVVCLRPDAMPETARLGSHTREVWGHYADRMGMTLERFLDQPASAPLRRNPTLDEVANVAVFMASDRAGAMTGTVANISCGAVTD